MRKFLHLCALYVSFGSAMPAIATDRTEAAAEGEIRAASAAFDDAQFRKDAAAMDRFLAADFKFVRASGKLTDRKEFIAGFADPAVTFEPFQILNRIFVQLGPDAAIVGGEGIIQGTDHGAPFREHFRYADTFHFMKGRWQVVYVQVTPLK